MPHFDFRNATSADLPELARLEEASFATDRLTSRSFRKHIVSPTAACRVAVEGGTIGGYYLLFFRAGSTAARLYSFAVAASRRGSGLAGRLLADAEAAGWRHGARRLHLEVRTDNQPAIRLYERHGYRLAGRRFDFYADGADALLYEKNLAKPPEEGRSPRDSATGSAYIKPVKGAKPVRPRSAARRMPPLAEPLPPTQ